MKYDNNRLLVVVSGSFTAKDQHARPFTQTFILVGQNNSFFVSNSVFRLLSEEAQVEQHAAPVAVAAPQAVPEPVVPSPEPVPEPQPEPVVEVQPEPAVEETPSVPSSSATTAEVVEVPETKTEAPAPAAPVEEVDVTTKSYSDIVKKLASKNEVVEETNKKGFRTVPSKPAPAAPAPAVTTPTAAAPAPAPAPAAVNKRRTDVHPVYITGYAKDAKEDELAKLFSQYGEVYQVELVKGKDFGFVKFELESSMQAALDNKTLEVDGNVIRIEKRTIPKKPGSKDGDRKTGDKNGKNNNNKERPNNNKGKPFNREGRDNNNTQKKQNSKPTA